MSASTAPAGPSQAVRRKEGESIEQCAYRETLEETGIRVGSVGKLLMRRVKDDGDGPVDFSTYLTDIEDEITPRLNHEHSSFGWFDPTSALQQAKAADGNGLVSSGDSAARADSTATPIVGGEGHSELEAALKDGMLEDELERSAETKDGPGHLLTEDEVRSAAESPAAPAPLYPTADLLGEEPEDDPDLDDLSDEDTELMLSVIEDLQDRLDRLEEGVRDDAVPVQDRKAAQGIGRRFRSI